MRLLGSIAILKALPPFPTLVGRGMRGLARANRLTPLILTSPSFFSYSSQTLSSSAVTSLTVAASFTPQVGNLLIAHCQVTGSGKTFSVSSGWTIGDTAADGAASWAWCVWDGSQGNPTFSWSGGVACAGLISQWSGVNASPIGTIAKASGSGTTLSRSGIVTTANLSRVVAIECVQTSQSIPASVGWDGHAINNVSNGSNRLQSQNMPVIATSGSISVTISSAAWECFLIEIKRP
jgi:hypothetical protein